MRNSSNMVFLIFGSTLPDHVHIGPINLRCFSCYGYGHGKSSCKEASRCGNCSALDSHSEEHYNAAAYCFHCRDTHQVRSRQCPRYRLEQDILQLANSQFISLGSARHELLYRQKSLKGLTKRYRGSAESIDLAQPKQSKVSPDAHDRNSSRDRSAMVPLMISIQPSMAPSVSDRASCDEDGLSMESFDDIITAVPRGPTVSKSAVQPDPRPPMTGRNGDNSHHSPVGRKAAVHRTGTPQLLMSSRRLIISSQMSHRQTLQKAHPSTAHK
ncbi:hypothetical protein E2C01_043058 [Portunus trituberculatus]|uniref:CCHC-type domain-containing protein n=1 Tax=Portunus trituberculatus TaxID=210409 RepID=A0A5B7FNF9_PORTR|nr:hypothetical protein [Portunus trituberculatus]